MNRRTALTTIAAALGLPTLAKAMRSAPTPATPAPSVPLRVAQGPVEIIEFTVSSLDAERTRDVIRRNSAAIAEIVHGARRKSVR